MALDLRFGIRRTGFAVAVATSECFAVEELCDVDYYVLVVSPSKREQEVIFIIGYARAKPYIIALGATEEIRVLTCVNAPFMEPQHHQIRFHVKEVTANVHPFTSGVLPCEKATNA